MAIRPISNRHTFTRPLAFRPNAVRLGRPTEEGGWRIDSTERVALTCTGDPQWASQNALATFGNIRLVPSHRMELHPLQRTALELAATVRRGRALCRLGPVSKELDSITLRGEGNAQPRAFELVFESPYLRLEDRSGNELRVGLEAVPGEKPPPRDGEFCAPLSAMLENANPDHHAAVAQMDLFVAYRGAMPRFVPRRKRMDLHDHPIFEIRLFSGEVTGILLNDGSLSKVAGELQMTVDRMRSSFLWHPISADFPHVELMGLPFGRTRVFEISVLQSQGFATYQGHYTRYAGFTELHLHADGEDQSLYFLFSATGSFLQAHERRGRSQRMIREFTAADRGLGHYRDALLAVGEVAGKNFDQGAMRGIFDLFDPAKAGLSRVALIDEDIRGKDLVNDPAIFQPGQESFQFLRALGFRVATEKLVRAMLETPPRKPHVGLLTDLPDSPSQGGFRLARIDGILIPVGAEDPRGEFYVRTDLSIQALHLYGVKPQVEGFQKGHRIAELMQSQNPTVALQMIDITELRTGREGTLKNLPDGVSEDELLDFIDRVHQDISSLSYFKGYWSRVVAGDDEGSLGNLGMNEMALLEKARQGILFMHPQPGAFFDEFFF